MADVEIIGLPTAGTITGTEIVPVVQNGLTVQTTVASITASPSQTQPFLTVSQQPTLPNSRYLSAINGIQIADGGAQNPLTLSIVTNPTIPGNAGMAIPSGTTAQRNTTPAAVRLNTETLNFEGFNGTNWSSFVTSVTYPLVTFSAGTTGFTPNVPTGNNVILAGTLNVSNGGTGLTSLTANYIPYGNGTGAFQSSVNLQFDGTAATINGQLNLTNASDYNLYASGAGANYMAGKLGIGAVPTTTVMNLTANTNPTGGTALTGISQTSTIQSDVTASYYANITTLATAAAAFTLTNINHYRAAQGTFGVGSTVTNQYGFFAGASLVGATNNYGFNSSIPSGTGRYNFYAAGTAANVFVGTTSLGGAVGSESLRVTPVASAVNFWDFYGGATGSDPYLYPSGSDTNRGFKYLTKGTGSHQFQTDTNLSNTQFVVAHTASAVNYLQVAGNVTGGYPYLVASGSDTNIGVDLIAKGTGALRFITASGTATQFVVSHTASAVNYLQATGSVTGSGATLSAQGSDTNIGLALAPKGAGLLTLGDPTLPGSGIALIGALFSSNTSAGNLLVLRKSADAAGGPNLSQLKSRGTASAPTAVVSGDAAGTNAWLMFDGTNYLSTGVILVSADGTPSTGVMFGRMTFSVNSGSTTSTERGRVDSAGNWYFGAAPGAHSLQVAPTASSVNYVQVAGAVTTAAPTISVAGTDTNINLLLTPKGTGTVQFGTYTAGILAQTGYITITDAGGTSRRLLVG